MSGTIKEREYQIEYTLPGERQHVRHRFLTAFGWRAAVKEFQGRMADENRAGVEVMGVWRREALGSTTIQRTNVIKAT